MPSKRFSLTGNNVSKLRPSSRSSYGEAWQNYRKSHSLTDKICKCGRPAVERDHIIPVAKGGQHAEFNIQPLCLRCHLKKHGKQQSVKNNFGLASGQIKQRKQLSNGKARNKIK